MDRFGSLVMILVSIAVLWGLTSTWEDAEDANPHPLESRSVHTTPNPLPLSSPLPVKGAVPTRTKSKLKDDPHPEIVPSMADEVSLPTRKATPRKYGATRTWKEVKPVCAYEKAFEVMEPYTGATYQILATSAGGHMDYVPATKRDAAILYNIYGKEWSWSRKSMLVKIGDEWIAASTNGMPHASSKERGNDIYGVFCMHFKDSRTNGSKIVCPKHQACIKAVGR